MLKSLHAYQKLGRDERRFAASAWLVAPFVTAALEQWGLERTRRAIERLPALGHGKVTADEGERLVAAAWARQPLARGACLPRALTQYALHRLDRRQVALVIGVNRNGEAIAAHAWVAEKGAETAGRAGDDGRSFSPLEGPR